jgi:hypothetical protein
MAIDRYLNTIIHTLSRLVRQTKSLLEYEDIYHKHELRRPATTIGSLVVYISAWNDKQLRFFRSVGWGFTETGGIIY